MDLKIEETILYHLFYNEKFLRKVVPFLQEEYWSEQSDKIIFRKIREYVDKYNKVPTKEEIFHEVDSSQDDISDVSYTNVKALLTKFGNKSYEEPNQQWLLDNTEAWCKDRAVYNGIMDAVRIIDGSITDKTKHAIPELLTQALSVSFDTKIGHNYIDDSDSRYDEYANKTDVHIPFDISYLNTITDGGLIRKTLNVIMSGTGVGKTLAMCHFAGSYLKQNKSVLYITCEMSENRIAERIDANLMNVPVSDIKNLTREEYNRKFDRIKKSVKGQLFIKEYPTASASSIHFKHLIEELATKKKFVPDVVFIDYMNICASSRVKASDSNSYGRVKSIAEELRGLAVEKNVILVTATQVNRTGYSDSDFGLESTSESFGVPMTADLFLALISTEELDEQKQICVKQLKNRYRDEAMDRKFLIGIDKPKMRLYDVEESAQRQLINFSRKESKSEDSDFGKRNFADRANTPRTNNSDFNME